MSRYTAKDTKYWFLCWRNRLVSDQLKKELGTPYDLTTFVIRQEEMITKECRQESPTEKLFKQCLDDRLNAGCRGQAQPHWLVNARKECVKRCETSDNVVGCLKGCFDEYTLFITKK
jgi:hypothetical protein